jgi:phosphoglycerate dehydrogenase-like enzyme
VTGTGEITDAVPRRPAIEGSSLRGKTLGSFGYGRIGRVVAGYGRQCVILYVIVLELPPAAVAIS